MHCCNGVTHWRIYFGVGLSDVLIPQELLVRTAKVAKMICGIRGRIILQMRRNVTHKLERLWGHKVVLHIHVKVADG